jgi:predicted TIM-barrel fold metal-dependent hydrolase
LIIDCHSLVATQDVARYPIAEGVPLLEPNELDQFTQAETLERLVGVELAAAVLVQRGRFYGYDNALICDLAAAHPALRALCSVDTLSASCAENALSLLSRKNVNGLRFMEPQKGADVAWLAGSHAHGAWKALSQSGAIAYVHFFPWNRAAGLEALVGLLKEYRDIPVVVDNLAACGIEQGAPDYGLDAALVKLLDDERVILKFSAMTFERAAKAQLDPSALLARYIALVGSRRLIWGSDVIPPGTTLAAANEEAQAVLSGLGGKTRQALLHDNAARIFGF